MTIYHILNLFFDSIRDPQINPHRSWFERKYLAWCYYRSRFLLNILIRIVNTPQNGLNSDPRSEKIIASLTTYPGRIDTVFYAIKSIMLQTYKPDRIILWLASNQFPERKLPPNLLGLETRGLEIRYCDDYRSHKKYYNALLEQKQDELVMTFDDDIIYNARTIERAFNKHLKYPKAVVSNLTKIVRCDNEGQIMPYKYWKKNPARKKPSFGLSPLTGSGCLYPYGVMCDTTFNWDVIKNNALTADDIWICFMANKSGTQIVEVDKPRIRFSTIMSSQESCLGNTNVNQGGNDVIVKKLSSLFPEVVDIIRKTNMEL